MSERTAFATVGKGVSLLKPGDTLTILPGHYVEAVAARITGTPEEPITIRAQRPGTVLLRGDVDVSGFQRVEGTRYTYWVAFGKRAEAIADRANLRLMSRGSRSPKSSGTSPLSPRIRKRHDSTYIPPIRRIPTGMP